MSAGLSEQQLAEYRKRAAERGAALTDWLNRHSPFPGMDAVQGAEAVLEVDVPALLVEVERLRLSAHERLILRFALESADDVMANNPVDFTDEDRAAMEKLRGLATGPVVAYRNPWSPGVLLCREHGEGWAGLKPLSPEDLPDGGTCTYGDPADPADVCGRGVLIDPTEPGDPS